MGSPWQSFGMARPAAQLPSVRHSKLKTLGFMPMIARPRPRLLKTKKPAVDGPWQGAPWTARCVEKSLGGSTAFNANGMPGRQSFLKPWSSKEKQESEVLRNPFSKPDKCRASAGVDADGPATVWFLPNLRGSQSKSSAARA